MQPIIFGPRGIWFAVLLALILIFGAVSIVLGVGGAILVVQSVLSRSGSAVTRLKLAGSGALLLVCGFGWLTLLRLPISVRLDPVGELVFRGVLGNRRRLMVADLRTVSVGRAKNGLGNDAPLAPWPVVSFTFPRNKLTVDGGRRRDLEPLITRLQEMNPGIEMANDQPSPQFRRASS
jgi:hypothetical protein